MRHTYTGSLKSNKDPNLVIISIEVINRTVIIEYKRLDSMSSKIAIYSEADEETNI
jgi:hypothetical protein